MIVRSMAEKSGSMDPKKVALWAVALSFVAAQSQAAEPSVHWSAVGEIWIGIAIAVAVAVVLTALCCLTFKELNRLANVGGLLSFLTLVLLIATGEVDAQTGRRIVGRIEGAMKAAGAEAPKAEAPKTEAPKTEAPKTEAPKAEAPKAEVPKAEVPKAEAPKAEAPEAEAPKPRTPS